MPLKSWSCRVRGHAVRVENWWRLTGRSRQRLFIDHELADERSGRFARRQTLSGRLGKDGTLTADLSQRPFAATCRLSLNGGPLDPAATDDGRILAEHLWFAPWWVNRTVRPVCRLYLLLLPLLPLGVIVLPAVIATNIVLWLGGRTVSQLIAQRNRRLKALGRFMPWSEVEERLHAGSGVLVCVQRGDDDSTWWIDHDVRQMCPFREDLEHVAFAGPLTDRWVRERYLSVDGHPGAYLTENSGQERDPQYRAGGLLLFDVYGNLIQDLSAVAWHRLLDLVGDDAAKALPALLAALDGPDAELRYPARMVIETLGERAASAVPFFADRFLHGPCGSRDMESGTLHALGAEGRRVLRRAAQLGDPSIAVPARVRIGEGNVHMDELLFEALHAPGENARLRAAERLFAERDRRWVEDSLIAALADDSPSVRHRALCALGVGGRQRRHAHPRAIHLSPLYGAEIPPAVLDALMEAYGSENAPWVAVDLVKAVGEADYSGSLADRLPRAQEFLRAAAEGNSSLDVREAAAEGLARLTAAR